MLGAALEIIGLNSLLTFVRIGNNGILRALHFGQYRNCGIAPCVANHVEKEPENTGLFICAMHANKGIQHMHLLFSRHFILPEPARSSASAEASPAIR